MCSLVSAVSAAVASSPKELHAWTLALLSELQDAANSGAAPPSLATPVEVAAEASRWRSYMHPFARLLCSTLHISAPIDNSMLLPSASFTDGKWEEALLDYVRQLASWPDAEAAETVTQLMKSLVQNCARRKSSFPAVLLPKMEVVVRRVVEASSPALLSAVVQACQVRTRRMGSMLCDVGAELTSAGPSLYSSEAEEDLHGCCRWHPFMSDKAIKVCLERMVQVLTTFPSERRKGKAGGVSIITPVTRLQIQQCCLCQIPRHMDDHTRHECAMLAMKALKQAPFTVLLAAYQYFRDERLVSVMVAERFLAHCGVCVTHVTQRGVSLPTYLSPEATKAAAEALLHARSKVLNTGRDSQQSEATISYAIATLNALGFPDVVRSFYSPAMSTIMATPAFTLCETPHSVMSQVLLRNVSGAVVALEVLGTSRPEGWLSVPPAVTESMVAVSRLVGQEGSAADMDGLYKALVGFHNAGLFISYYVECVLAGLCDRIRDIERRQPHAWKDVSKVSRAPPHEILEGVIPVFRATLRYVGDELNTDVILELLETALQLSVYAVPLTAALVSALRASMGMSLSLQELLCRVDPSTHNAPFLYYYILCYARDFGSPSTFDHLAALWHVDGDAIWNRAAHLSPPCRLWKCATCGRLNSDRYNYCVCSALRYSHVLCGACGYAQDERLRQCCSCGQTLLNKASLAGAVVRKTWVCRDCGARNPARQTLLCFRCGQPTGPCIQQHSVIAAAESQGSTASASASPGCCFCGDCNNDEVCDAASSATQRTATYAEAVGVCHECGRFKMDHAARSSFVWVCPGCHQRRSSLERFCPSCPQVECLPRAICREPVYAPRVCRHCGHEEANPFTVVCRGCSSAADPFVHRSNLAEATLLPVQEAATDGHSGPMSAQGVPNQRQPQVYHWCFHCHHMQPWDDTVPLHQQHCRECAADCEEKGRCSLPLRVCGGCGATLPTRYAGSAVCPYCATYLQLAPQPQRCDDGSAPRYWTAVTLLHTCEVLDECCARESLLTEGLTQATPTALVSTRSKTSAPDGSPAPGSAATAVDASARACFQRRPAIEKALSCLRREWCNIDSATWLSIRIDVVTLLGQIVSRLCPCLSTSLTARRLSALLKSILTHVDGVCGVAVAGSGDTSSCSVQGYFTPAEVCHECLGTHSPDLCPFLEGGGLWTCEECGSSHNNIDLCRYVCSNCLALRPVVQDLLISACWECPTCYRANLQFERYCMHCGAQRAAWCAAMLPRWDSAGDVAVYGGVQSPAAAGTGEPGDQGETTHQANRLAARKRGRNVQGHRTGLLNLESTAQALSQSFSSALSYDESNAAPLDSLAASPASATSPVCGDEIPFNPAKCPLCGLVYIEARCPLCLNHIPAVANAKGTVCEVQDRYAFIQPSGTTRPQDRIFVDEALLKANTLREGLLVHYTAELDQRGRMEARFLRC
ncbi:conserved hypothetical protein [Leishmania braziliensis MHOM/BR/75/M2904]|uniref:RanBP2-type domain-containing protein n=2 Tax=Leishmania braziliensis TaxID=5660 RepID=A4HN37_LEIBR|nr:conserved hypothetical protein [Leishmania braziliensis MHOM/BR/75/M2904]CAJ2480611.1 unnamed protein product [Leishmania braziliensis]CAM43580.1 conserved hypothetical protein [Leishmania braziliensis MHOM/BR/75/M2904]SYZ69637.1 hypothetical_protein [Leishmania braziliensis MHOM/BR/75/M2904]